MKEEKPPEDVQHWTSPPYIAPGIGEKQPVGAWVAKDAVCRNCMTAAEEVAMRRGFVDPIPTAGPEGKAYTCTRCGQRILAGS